jgi:hypothetical protein
MAITHTDYRSSASATTHNFADCDLGDTAPVRHILVGVSKNDGFDSAMTVEVDGTAASARGSSAVASQTRIRFFIVEVPTGTTADIVVTFDESSRCLIAVWRITNLESTAAHDTMWANAENGAINHAPLETVDGGCAVGFARLRLATGWVGLTQDFVDVDGDWRHTGASLGPTDGDDIAIPNDGGGGFNINAVWNSISFASGGLADDGPGGFLPDGIYDANPAHIIRESLTNTNWGMGAAESSLDDDSFRAAALTLYNEVFGLTMVWSQQTAIESFVGEVLDHIEAQLFLHPRTGLLTLKLIRGDYDVEDLPTISPANATLTNFQRKSWGETVNELIVSYTEHESGKAETVAAHDLASISIQGLVSDTRNYYGVRRRALAAKLANRDLRVASAPLAACDAELDRTQWDLVPGDVVKLDWPEYGINQIVMRVGPVDYGAPGNSKIKVSLAEDVFGLDAGDFTEPPDSEWEDPAEEPTSIDYYEVLSLPYWSVVQVVGSGAATAAVYPESAAGVLAAQGGADTSQYELETLVTDASGAGGYQRVATRSTLARMELADALDAEASTVLTVAGQTQGALPETGGFAFIGAGGDEAVELALVTAFNGETMAVSLDRGVLDTVPRAWPALTPVWFLNADQPWHDPTERAAGETASYRIRPRTSLGLLPRADAPVIEFEVGERPYLPSRPADVKVEGVGFGIVDCTAAAPVNVTVSERNRLTEDSQVLGWDDATVTPESGQTWKVELLDPFDRTLIATVDSLTGTSTTIAHSVFDGNSAAILRVTAERDGFESLQGHEIVAVIVGPTISGTPVETGETGVAYAGFTVSGTGGLAPYTFAVTAGTLPPGLALDPDAGDVAGTPSLNGTYSGIVITLTDAAGLTDDLAAFTVTIGAPAAGAILLSGDAQSGTDKLLLSGDEQSGTDILTHNDES